MSASEAVIAAQAISGIAKAFSSLTSLFGGQHLEANKIVQGIQNPWGVARQNIVDPLNAIRNAGGITIALDQAALNALQSNRNAALAAIAQYGSDAAATQARATINQITDQDVTNLTGEITKLGGSVSSVSQLSNSVSQLVATTSMSTWVIWIGIGLIVIIVLKKVL